MEIHFSKPQKDTHPVLTFKTKTEQSSFSPQEPVAAQFAEGNVVGDEGQYLTRQISQDLRTMASDKQFSMHSEILSSPTMLGKEQPRDIELSQMSGTQLSESQQTNSEGDIEWDNEDYSLDELGEDASLWDMYMPPSIATPSEATRISVKKVLLLYNPKSGAKKGTRYANKAHDIFTKNGIEVEMMKLEHAGHCEEICQTKDMSGYDVICVLGGDGTFHECINGYMRRNDDARTKIPVAMIPGGTGNSFALELQGGVKVGRAVRHIMRGLNCPIDIGEVYFPTENRIIYSFNSIHWGLGSKVNVTAERLRWMGKAIRYTTAAFVELMRGEKTLAQIEMWDKDDKKIEIKDYFCLLIANNIMSAAKGMKMAPQAKLNDGLIDILLVRSSKALDLMSIFKKVYDGTHTELDYVEYHQVKSFSVISLKETETTTGENNEEVVEELLDVDGELSGITPFKCTIIPRSLRVII